MEPRNRTITAHHQVLSAARAGAHGVRARLAGTLVLVAVTAAACSLGGARSDGAPATTGGSAAGQASNPTSPAAKVATAAGQPDDPIASAEGLGPNFVTNNRIPVRVDVLALDRATADTVLLRFRITNTGSDTVTFATSLGSGAGDYDVSGVSLIDLANNLRYLVLVDNKDDCVCTRLTTSADKLQPTESRTFEATLPAPAASVSLVDVQVSSYAIVHNVPIGGDHG